MCRGVCNTKLMRVHSFSLQFLVQHHGQQRIRGQDGACIWIAIWEDGGMRLGWWEGRVTCGWVCGGTGKNGTHVLFLHVIRMDGGVGCCVRTDRGGKRRFPFWILFLDRGRYLSLNGVCARER